MPSRRGFLKFLGKGGLAGAALAAPAAGYAMGVDKGEGDVGMFNFTCACGNGHIGKTPKIDGDKLEFDCECGTKWTLIWDGDHFNTKMRNESWENEALPNQLRDVSDDARQKIFKVLDEKER